MSIPNINGFAEGPGSNSPLISSKDEEVNLEQIRLETLMLRIKKILLMFAVWTGDMKTLAPSASSL
jgi:hypothetical protein